MRHLLIDIKTKACNVRTPERGTLATNKDLTFNLTTLEFDYSDN